MVLVELGASDASADNSRLDILSAAADCFMERGYAATSIDDVARRLHATKGRIYHHFPSKADLFAQIFRTGMDLNYGAIAPFRTLDGKAIARWKAMARAHTMQMIKTKPFQRVVWEGVEMHLRGSTTPEQRSLLSELIEYRTRYGDIFRDTIAAARAEGDMQFENIGIANQITMMTLNSPIFWYSRRPDEAERDTEKIVEQVVGFALRGLCGQQDEQNG